VVCNRASDLEKWLGRQDAAAEMAADRNSARVIRLRYDRELRATIPQERDTHTTYTYDTHSLSKVAHTQGKYTTKRESARVCVRA
jgi:hypothetical protein